jgi:hypothetical protein
MEYLKYIKYTVPSREREREKIDRQDKAVRVNTKWRIVFLQNGRWKNRNGGMIVSFSVK